MDNDVHECQCDGAGYCPVYKTQMSGRRYNKCKNDISWRKNYKDFFDTINSPSFQEAVQQRPEYKEMLNAIEAKIKESTKEYENKREEYRQYVLQQKEKEMAYFKSLSPEEQEAYRKKAFEYIKRRDKVMAEQQQLQQVVDNIKEGGVTSENYQENTEGLGDLISNALSKFGITEETVKKWSGTQKGGCGCDKRKQFLNAILPFRKKE